MGKRKTFQEERETGVEERDRRRRERQALKRETGVEERDRR